MTADEKPQLTDVERRRKPLEAAVRQLSRTPPGERSLTALIVTNDDAILTTRGAAVRHFLDNDLPEIASAIRTTRVPRGHVCLITAGDESGVSVLAHDFSRKAPKKPKDTP